MIVIIDYGLGNIGSIQNMIKKIGYRALASSNLEDIKLANKLILPGVGSFDAGVRNLKMLGIWEVLNEKISNGTPIIGICLGMQLMTMGSEEGLEAGFGWINAVARKFRFSKDLSNLKIPHMGWNTVELKKSSRLFTSMENQKNRFYFVHSYAVECFDKEDIVATTNYGYEFVSVFEKSNIIGVQFHPEKSHRFGMQLLKNFIEKY